MNIKPFKFKATFGIVISGLVVFSAFALLTNNQLSELMLLSPSSTFADDNDSALNEKNTSRIVALTGFSADQLLNIGAAPVAVPGLRNLNDSDWDGIPKIQLDHSSGPNIEQIIASDPDYIISSSIYSQFMPYIESVTDAEVIYMDVDSISSIKDHIETLGVIAKREKEASDLVDSLSQAISGNQTRDLGLKVLAIFGTPHSFFAFMPRTYLGDLVESSGGTMGPEGLSSHKVYKGLAPLSMESVMEYDPDVLLVLFHGPESTSKQMFESDPLWKSLKAVNKDRMFFLSEDLYAMRPGSNLSDALAEISSCLNSVSALRND